MITIDFREQALIEIMKECNTCNLIHGDIIIGGSGSEGEHSYVIERKSMSDLSASIKDSRFREQKSRLLSVYSPDQIVYIIEKSKRNKSMLPESTLDSAILNLIFKHKFKVIFSENVNHTAKILKLLEKKISEEGVPDLYGKGDIGFLPIKKSTVSELNSLACQLATIPGVSRIIACAIQEKYKSMKDLITDLDKDNNVLNGLCINDKRKIGKKLSESIFNALYT